MKVTSGETYKVMRAILERKRFTQYEISKTEKVTFSLVNRVVNWLVGAGYVAKRKGFYELTAPAAIFGLFSIYRKMKPFASYEVKLEQKEVQGLLKGNAALCLNSALSHYDGYYRDPVIYAYALDEKLEQALKALPKGYTRIELYKEDLNAEDIVKKGQWKTSKIRTAIDLFCANRAYAAERLVKKEWV